MTDSPTPQSRPEPNQSAADQADSRELEHRYYQYLRENNYSSTDALLDVLRWYLPYFDGYQRVLDIGCGHGEFLQLLQAAGHEAVGIDIDPAMVATCHAQGLTAYEGDAIAWLQREQEPFDAIFSSNVIEHLDAPTVQTLIRSAHSALHPGGLLLMGTPNPESLIVQFHEFWRDPTHVRLYSRQLIEFFYADAGFVNIQNGNNAEAAWNGIDRMLDARELAAMNVQEMLALKQLPPTEQPLPPLHPLPQAPEADAPLRQRLTFRVVDFVYHKFLEPYLALMRSDQEHQRRQLQELQAQIVRLQQTNLFLEGALREAFQQSGSALRFLYPPREHFVFGYKADPNASEHTDPNTNE